MLELPVIAKNFKLKTKHYESFCEKFDELGLNLSKIYKIIENEYYTVGECSIMDYYSPKEIMNYLQEFNDDISVNELDLDEWSFKDLPYNGLSVSSNSLTKVLDKDFGIEHLLTNSLTIFQEYFNQPEYVVIREAFNPGFRKTLFFSKDEITKNYHYLKFFAGHYSLEKKYFKIMKRLGFTKFFLDDDEEKFESNRNNLSPGIISSMISSIRGYGFIKKPVQLEIYYSSARIHLSINTLKTFMNINTERENSDIMHAVRTLNTFFSNYFDEYLSINAKVKGKN